jgi:hypothetical protein
MPESTKTIAFRVAAEIEEQIQALANVSGQSKSEWVRNRVMEALHGSSPEVQRETKQPPPAGEPSPSMLHAINTRLQEVEAVLKDRIEAEEKAKRQTADLIPLQHEVQGFSERRIAVASTSTVTAPAAGPVKSIDLSVPTTKPGPLEARAIPNEPSSNQELSPIERAKQKLKALKAAKTEYQIRHKRPDG